MFYVCNTIRRKSVAPRRYRLSHTMKIEVGTSTREVYATQLHLSIGSKKAASAFYFLAAVFTKAEEFQRMPRDLEPFLLTQPRALLIHILRELNVFNFLAVRADQVVVVLAASKFVALGAVAEIYRGNDALRFKEGEFAVHGCFIGAQFVGVQRLQQIVRGARRRSIAESGDDEAAGGRHAVAAALEEVNDGVGVHWLHYDATICELQSAY